MQMMLFYWFNSIRYTAERWSSWYSLWAV